MCILRNILMALSASHVVAVVVHIVVPHECRVYTIYTLSGQKYFNTFKLCHMVEICMPLKLFVLKITSSVLIYLIIG